MVVVVEVLFFEVVPEEAVVPVEVVVPEATVEDREAEVTGIEVEPLLPVVPLIFP